ncbi:hypothetical protein QBC36DRAFT_170469, partial [Triangularia setosa]
QLKTLLALLPLVATALNYVVPEDTPDGFYAVTSDESGNSTTQHIDPSTLTAIGESLEKRSPIKPSPRYRRQSPVSWGGTGRTFP